MRIQYEYVEKDSTTHLSFLNDEAIIYAWLEHLQHLRVIEIKADMLQNIPVGYNAKSAEDNPDGNVNLDVRDRGFHDIPGLKWV